MRFGNSNITIGQQVHAMRSYFPQFKYKRVNQKPTWVGCLQPTVASPKYRVKVEYSSTYPKVWVLSPSITDAPHRYPDKSLCLYYPKDRSWTQKKYTHETIVPWVSEWLVFYELWCVTGVWYGPEAPHSGEKKPSL